MPGAAPVPAGLERRRLELPGLSLVIDAPSSPDEHVRGAERRGRSASDAYWAHAWPAAGALAEWVLASSMLAPGVRVLELGCGLGIAGFAAAARGARVLLTDAMPEAVHAALGNAQLNALTCDGAVFDWRDSVPDAWRADLVLGADVLYDPGAHLHIARVLKHLACPGVLVDPLRPGQGDGAQRLREAGLSAWGTPLRTANGEHARLIIAQAPDARRQA